MVDPADLPEHMKACPIEVASKYIGRKWGVNIIRDLFLGHQRFSEFLKSNPDPSTKMLAARLRELESDGLIQKKTASTSPVVTHYELTDKGRALSRVMLEMAIFSFQYCKTEVYRLSPQSIEDDIGMMKRILTPPSAKMGKIPVKATVNNKI